MVDIELTSYESYYKLQLICSLPTIKNWQDATASVLLNQTFASASNKTHDRIPESRNTLNFPLFPESKELIPIGVTFLAKTGKYL